MQIAPSAAPGLLLLLLLLTALDICCKPAAQWAVS
jgi:hypothetical protein